MPIAAILALLNSVLNVAPFAISTVAGIREILARDPNVPEDLAALLAGTQADNAATMAAIEKWMSENPKE